LTGVAAVIAAGVDELAPFNVAPSSVPGLTPPM